MLGVTSLAEASAAPLARRSATPLGCGYAAAGGDDGGEFLV
jgi:hypothetical protein